MTGAEILAVEGLSLSFRSREGEVRALADVSFSLAPGETLGVVGESGSGKSVAALAIMGLLARTARIDAGRIRFEGRELLGLDERHMRSLRGRRLAMVFQNPRRSLNPLRPIGRQLCDVLRVHRGLGRAAARSEASALLARVGIADPAARLEAYPFELSGGMCQRVMIALALAAEPALLIADEPTTGLDTTVQALILDLIGALARDRGMATLLITHDLALAAERCDRIAVMHAGQLVEIAPARTLFAQPAHPFTEALIGATPAPSSVLGHLAGVPGLLPDLTRTDLPACRYFGRCPRRGDACRSAPIPLRAIGAGHAVACLRV